MALTRNDIISDGGTTVYTVDFRLGFISQDHIYVYQGDDYETQLGYTWLNTTQITLDVPLRNGEEFHIRRVVPRDRPINDYQAGAILREQNLDNSFIQALQLLEEYQDGYINIDDALTIIEGDVRITGALELFGILNMNGFEIINVGDATSNKSAANVDVVAYIVAEQLNAYDPQQYLDYGLITDDSDEVIDYGGLS